MVNQIPITSVTHELNSLPQKLSQEDTVIAITSEGEPVLALMTWQHYEAILETLEVLSDRNLIAHLRQGIAEAKSGEGLDWELVKQDLNL
jgi:antitoxin YefM